MCNSTLQISIDRIKKHGEILTAICRSYKLRELCPSFFFIERFSIYDEVHCKLSIFKAEKTSLKKHIMRSSSIFLVVTAFLAGLVIGTPVPAEEVTSKDLPCLQHGDRCYEEPYKCEKNWVSHSIIPSDNIIWLIGLLV